MVRTLTLFVAALAATFVSAPPLGTRHRGQKLVHTLRVCFVWPPLTPAQGALAATPTVPTAVGAGANAAVDASITAAAAAASASAAAVQQALIDGNTTPGEGFISPDFEGEEAFLDTKISLEEDAGEDDAAAADQEALSELNQSAEGGSESD
ncbi:hypothetical protein B0H14DRAFT_2621233 [Mycena olivaceomarginata]|nr:hypothetical protein B0H14DRAFT_2621233 [Mycena olivaceomarginata]